MTLTGVSWHFSAAHREQGKAWFHGHTWGVKAWFSDTGEDARLLQSRLKAVLVRFDHKELPAEMARGETIAQLVGEELDGCIEVEVARAPEGIFAKWRKS